MLSELKYPVNYRPNELLGNYFIRDFFDSKTVPNQARNCLVDWLSLCIIYGLKGLQTDAVFRSQVRIEVNQSQKEVKKEKRRLRRFLKFPRSWKEVKALGWKFVLGFILFYLIRDTILYILIPWLIYKGIIGN